jgi:hypothetical protein
VPQIDVGPFLRSMENELRSCEAARATEILKSLDRWCRDTGLREESRREAQRLAGKARFRLALLQSVPAEPAHSEGAVLGRPRDHRPPAAAPSRSIDEGRPLRRS